MGFEDGYTYPYEELVIPSSYNDLPVTEISKTAFSECVKNVTSLVLPDSLQSLEPGVLGEFTNLISLTIPFVGKNRETGLTLMELFSEQNRNNVNLPTSLTSVTVTDSICIYERTFFYAPGLTDIRINEGCTELEPFAIADCLALESLYLPSSLETIDDRAFSRSFSQATAPTIYFAGSESQWQSIAENCDIPEASLSYKE